MRHFTSEARAVALTKIEQRHRDNEREADRRHDEFMRTHPDMSELFSRRRKANASYHLALIRDGAESAKVAAAKQELDDARTAWAEGMAKLGLAPDALEVKYTCPTCKDKGWIGANMCQCLEQMCVNVQREALTKRMVIAGQSFETFDLSWYSTQPDQRYMMPPREAMEYILKRCKSYVANFDAGEPGIQAKNLILMGEPGLGKTFLSTCIANEVSKRGFSVVYETAGNIFGAFEEEQFGRRDEDWAEAKENKRRCLDCDLLVLDDLGCELTTKFVVKVLYDIVNDRQNKGLGTVISTNLCLPDIDRRYSPAIASRLEGYYDRCMFFGEDIRKLKKRTGGKPAPVQAAKYSNFKA